MSNYTIITNSAIVSDDNGYNQDYGVTICDQGDTISIGATEHSKAELNIDIANHRISSKLAGWDLSW